MAGTEAGCKPKLCACYYCPGRGFYPPHNLALRVVSVKLDASHRVQGLHRSSVGRISLSPFVVLDVAHA